MSAPGCVNINRRKSIIYQAAIQLLIQERNKPEGVFVFSREAQQKNAVDEAVAIYELVTKHPAMNTPGFGLPPAPEPAGRISLKKKPKKLKKLPTPPQPKFGKLKKIE